MQEQDGLNSEQRELESALRGLTPVNRRLNTISAAFEAGRMVQRRRVRALSGVTVMMIFITGASLIWNQRPSPLTVHDKITVAPVSEAQDLSVSSPPGPTLLTLERSIRSQGIDGLPATNVPHSANINTNNPL